MGCRARPGAGQAAAPAGDEAAQANAVLVAERLPSNGEVVRIAQAAQARAEREGTGPRAAALSRAAGLVYERLYRVEHQPDDATRAVEAYQRASRDPASPVACEVAPRMARLAGELARDPSRTYAELYRAHKRLGGAGDPTCVEGLRAALDELQPFRPPGAVLDAIDHGLLGAGESPAAPVVAGDGGGAVTIVPPRVMRLEQWASPDGARIVVHLDRPARFKVGEEAGRTTRTFVDLEGVELEAGPQEIKLGGVATALRAEPRPDGARVVVDLAGPCYRKVFHLVEPYRVVIDLARSAPAAAPRAGRKVARVVLDPGHGGHDPGAVGPTGLQEKDVTLAIAHKVAPILARQGLAVMLTRDTDRFVTLEERTARANAFAADVFVSVHCNAAEVRSKHGMETYVLDTDANEMAGRIAARENATSAKANAELAAILGNMRVADQATRSRRFGVLLQRAALASLSDKYADVLDGGVHVAGFYVLVGARMPAVLFETSYISNPTEEQRLASEEYRARLADGIANAITAYREGR